MKTKLYLITGASGHVGNMLLQRLIKRVNKESSEKICLRVLKLKEDDTEFDKRVEVICGDVSDRESLKPFFECKNYDEICLIHCASIISIQSFKTELLRKINVIGTLNILELSLENKLNKVIYVSSVHAIQEERKGKTIKEVKNFSQAVVGEYAKTKAEASQLAIDFAKKGLNVSIVHPSGIIGFGDKNNTNNSNNLILRAKNSKFFAYTKGGYDFVDIEDVINGILSCENNGKAGECYILSGEYITIKEVLETVKKYNKGLKLLYIPLPLAKIAAIFAEYIAYLRKVKPLFTPYSLYTINSNALFSNKKAKQELRYSAKPIKEVIETFIKED